MIDLWTIVLSCPVALGVVWLWGVARRRLRPWGIAVVYGLVQFLPALIFAAMARGNGAHIWALLVALGIIVGSLMVSALIVYVCPYFRTTKER